MKKKTDLFLAAIVVLLIFAPITGFSYTKQLDEQLIGVGNSGIMIQNSDGRVGAAEFRSRVLEYAEETGTTISVQVQDPAQEEDVRYIYVAPGANGAPAEEWLEDGRRSFSQDQDFQFGHLGDLDNKDPRGMYLINGLPGSDHDFLHFVQEQGYEGSVMTSYRLQSWLANSSLMTIALALLLAFSLVVAYVVTRSRMFAVYQLWGKSLWGSFLIDLRDHGRGAFIVAGIVSVITIIALGMYNQFAQFYLFTLCSLLILGVGAVAVLAGYVSGHLVLRLSPLVESLKGGLPHSIIAGGVYAIRLAALAVALGLVASAATLFTEAERLSSEREAWSSHTEETAVGIATGQGEDYVQIAPALRELDTREQVLLVDDLWRVGSERPASSTLLVNSAFARQEANINNADLPSLTSTARIFAPAHVSESEVQHNIEGLQAEAEMAGVETPDVDVVRYSDSKKVFTYSTSYGVYPQPSIVSDPILVVLAPGMEVLSDRNLASKLTSASLLFRDESVLEPLLADDTSRQWFAAAYPVVNNWLDSWSTTQEMMRTQLLNLTIALAIVSAAVVGVALTYNARNRRRLNVRFLLGLSPWSARTGLYIGEAALFLVPVLWLFNRYSALESASKIPSPNSQATYRALEAFPSVIWIVLACSLIWAVAAVLVSMKDETAVIQKKRNL